MGLLSDIYNTVAEFFRPQEEPEGEASKSVATNRLKLVLMQDRTNLTPRILEQMRSELIDLLSRYVELDKELLELNFEQEGDQVALMLSIPVIRAKDEEEIEEAIKAHKEKMKNLEEGSEEDSEEETENKEESEDFDETDDISEDDEEITDESDEEETEDISEEIQNETPAVTAPEGMTSSKTEAESEEEKTEIS